MRREKKPTSCVEVIAFVTLDWKYKMMQVEQKFDFLRKEVLYSYLHFSEEESR